MVSGIVKLDNTKKQQKQNTRKATNSRKNKVVAPPAPRQRPQTRRPVQKAGMAYNYPLTAVTQIRQSASQSQTVRFSGSDRIGGITFGPNTPVNTPIVFKMSPPDLPNTRAASMAKNYQLFRFKKMELTVFSNLPTTSGGGYTTGYTENPEQGFSTGPSLPGQVYALPNSIAGNLFVPTKMKASISDKSKWYRLDQDSSEVMNTTQGMFVICVESLTAITTAITVPVYLDYEVEFKGSAIQVDQGFGTVLLYPALAHTPGAINTWVLSAVPGEPALANNVLNVPYLINPGFQVSGQLAEVVRFSAGPSGTTVVQYFKSEDDYSAGTPIGNNGDLVPFTNPRTSIERLLTSSF